MKRRLLRAFVAVALVLQVVAAPVAIPMMQEEQRQASPVGDSDAQVLLPVCGAVEVMTADSCIPGNNPDNNLDKQEDHTGIYTEAISLYSQSRTYTELMDNYAQDFQDVAFLRMESAVAAASENDTTKTEAKTKAVETADSYYYVHDRNFLTSWNNHIASQDQMMNWSSSAGVTVFTTPDTAYQMSQDTSASMDVHVEGTTTGSAELVNGSTATVRQVVVDFTADGGSYSGSAKWDPYNGLQDNGGDHGSYIELTSDFQVHAQPPDSSSYSQEDYIHQMHWSDALTKIQDEHSETVTETEAFVDGVWSDLDSGEIDATDILSKANLANNYQLDGTGDNATYSDVVAALAASGLDTPDLVNTSYMEINYTAYSSNSTNTYEGMLLSGDSPESGVWDTNTTYQTANKTSLNATYVSGVQAIAKTSGGITHLNGTFSVAAAYDLNGDRINDPTFETTKRDYVTSNTTRLQEKITQLGETLSDIEERQQHQAGGGSGWDVEVPGMPNVGPEAAFASLIGLIAIAGAALIVVDP